MCQLTGTSGATTEVPLAGFGGSPSPLPRRKLRQNVGVLSHLAVWSMVFH